MPRRPPNKMRLRLISTLSLLTGFAAGLSACASSAPDTAKFTANPPAWAQSDPVRYKCADSRVFDISFSTTGAEAAVKLNDKLYPLQRATSGSGIRYGSDLVDYTAKGRTAQLTRSPNGTYLNCKVVD